MVLAAISRETHLIGLIDTISSFYEPYLAAYMLSSLHQISHSCIGAKLDNQYIHPLHYQEKYFQVDGLLTFKHPNMADHVYFRTSIPGRDLAVRYVDAIFQLRGVYKMNNSSDKTFIKVPWK